MSISIQGRTGWAAIPNNIARSRLPHPTLHLLVNLLTHEEGFNATYATIRDQTGMGRTTISTALDNLKRLGLLSVEKVKGKDGRFDSNSYIFHADLLWRLSPEFVDDRLRGTGPGDGLGEDLPSPGAGLGTGPGAGLGPVPERDRKKTNLKNQVKEDQSPIVPTGDERDEPSLFDDTTPSFNDSPETELEHQLDQVMEAYPYASRTSRKVARQKLKVALKKTDFDTIMAGVQGYAAECERSRKEMQYTAHLATWFNQERWTVDYGASSSPAKTDMANLKSRLGRLSGR